LSLFSVILSFLADVTRWGLMKLFTRTQPAPRLSLDGVPDFLAELAEIAPLHAHQTHRFPSPCGSCRGFVQFGHCPAGQVTVHRIWTLAPGQGHGSAMLQTICGLADRHGIHIHLKALPFGNKPYPLTRDGLLDWYRRHGFEGTHKKLIRTPRRAA
jgi:hypothetical protein